jgi:predicted nucleic acid-binding protein
MLIVADTSPINYLILVDAVQVLPVLYGRIVIPPEVSEELRHPDAPTAGAGMDAVAAHMA